jgi:pilus assembly protein CpaE
MYPLGVNLVGLDEDVAPHVRRELLNQPAQLEGEYREARELIGRHRLAQKDTRLLIVQVRGQADLNEVRRLGSTFPGWPIVALVDAQQGAGLFLKVNRAGAAQVVTLPLAPGDFREALTVVGLQFGFTSRPSTVLAVTGSTGGCGATSLAVNLAAEAAFVHRQHAVLVELAQQMGVCATYLDVEPRTTLPDLLADLERLDVYLVQQSLTRVADDFDLLAGPQHLSSPVRVAADEVFQVVDHLRKLAALVVLDVPCNYGDLQFEVLAQADQVVLVGEQTIPSVRAMKLMIDSLRRTRGEEGLHLVINRYDGGVEGFAVDDLARLLKVAAPATVTADPAALKAAANQGRPLRLVASRSPALADVDRLLARLLGVQAPASPVGSGLFRRLVGAFGR